MRCDLAIKIYSKNVLTASIFPGKIINFHSMAYMFDLGLSKELLMLMNMEGVKGKQKYQKIPLGCG